MDQPHANTAAGRVGRILGNRAGWSLSELIVMCAITGIVAAVSIPWMISANRAFNATHGAREIQAALNQARVVAITTRQNICFTSVTGGYAFRQGSCAGTAWVGPDTDATGRFRQASNVTLTPVTPNVFPIFTPFGTASTSGGITVTAATGTTITVTVLPSGRVTIP
jgi:Tfp pilus assembly protein FimT